METETKTFVAIRKETHFRASVAEIRVRFGMPEDAGLTVELEGGDIVILSDKATLVGTVISRERFADASGEPHHRPPVVSFVTPSGAPCDHMGVRK